MNPELAFITVTIIALVGWITLVAGVLTGRRFLIDKVAGRGFPVALACAYALIAPGFFTTSEGGFDCLANLQIMFGAPWLVLGGWIHWLVTDLFIASWISIKVMDKGWGRKWLAGLLPLAFFVGPVGFLAYHLIAIMKSGKTRTG